MKSAPFDSVSTTYDEEFSQSILGGWLREQVWARLSENFKAGDRVLELGCGTGEDAVWLAKRDVKVTATDQSARMLDIARQKLARSNLAKWVSTELLDLNHLPELKNWRFDGVFANFGVLNCVEDCSRLAQVLSEWINPGGRAVFIVMNRYCPWEIMWFSLRGRFRESQRRFARDGLTVALNGDSTVRVWYPTSNQLRHDFEPTFVLTRLQGLGALLPPSYLKHLVTKYPRTFNYLHNFERKWAGRFPWKWLNDHYIIELERI